MFSLRIAARSAPRVLRHSATPFRQAARTGMTATTLARASMTGRAAYSSLRRREDGPRPTKAASGGEVDEELISKLESELQIEDEIKDDAQPPASIGDFLRNAPFTIEDKPGVELVKLVRQFGNEKITVSFSISDLDTSFDPYDEDGPNDQDNDPALLDEEPVEPRSGKRNALARPGAGASRSGEMSAAEEEALADDQAEDDISEENAAPINLTIVVEKPGKTAGALSIHASARDGNIEVDSATFIHDAALVTSNTPDVVHKRVDLYAGPPFGSLDEDLQILIERFLEERGINQAMAIFVADYVDTKEQKEYLRWLDNIKGFVEA
ncbi:hypothetical protein XA68_11954 [Ophiocordyceps unilateralis]|uniref:Mitochondrial glyco protein n=1 Tax=Ophiocordyceps unilateralis TaxID=268505 RepID=A0A2A9PEG4_OPHUN|nr:hypothetical protein XA68_11954 [Ophiocordyceps unilateralis]